MTARSATRRRGRPAGDPARRRSAIITVRVTAAQHAEAVAIARREGLLVSELGQRAIAEVIRRGSTGTAFRVVPPWPLVPARGGKGRP